MKCLIFPAALFLAGCASGAASLTGRSDLQPNVGQTVRIIGTAHFYKIGCPSVATDEFEVFVYPRNLWGMEAQGKKVEVTGRLNDTRRMVPPDPYINPGEYWLSDSTWKSVTQDGK
jgi:hypothetical protein